MHNSMYLCLYFLLSILQEHSTLAEDEFYDAVESSNDTSADDAKQRKDQLIQSTKNNVQTSQPNLGELIRAAATNASLKHAYWSDVIYLKLYFVCHIFNDKIMSLNKYSIL